jgi:hypothetical protein
MSKGTVLFYKSFTFHDGGQSDKRVIILNEPNDNEPYLCCKTTSKEKYGLQYEGCYSDESIYVINPIDKCFTVKTWVQFHELYEITFEKFIIDMFKGQISELGTLNRGSVRKTPKFLIV